MVSNYLGKESTKMIKEYDRIRTLVDKTVNGRFYPKGTIGVVIDVCPNGKAYSVEIWDETKYPIDATTYEWDEMEVIPPAN